VPGDDGGASWLTLLKDIESTRVTDGRTGQYYFGIAKITHEFGIYGIAFPSAKAALGNDYLDDRNLNASMTLAHETGHSMGRLHVSCGQGLANEDPSYPHENGQIGSFGMDVSQMKQFGPDTKDLMGYCADRWIGDYTYEKVLEYRLTEEATVGLNRVPKVPSLIVWGQMDGRSLTLDPAYQVETRPYLPESGGKYRLEGLDAAGGVVFSISFDGEETDSPNHGRIFVYAIPTTVAHPERLVALRLSGGGRQTVRRASSGAAAGQGLSRASLRSGPAERGATRLEWDSASHPLVVLRDAETHEIISLVRGGSAALKLPSRPLEAIVSDGVHSASVGVINP
jgi:hypothetical protein